jgi:hypothetical protein
MPEIKRICAWCGKVMGTKPGNAIVFNGGRVDETHGICEACQEIVSEEIRDYRKSMDSAIKSWNDGVGPDSRLRKDYVPSAWRLLKEQAGFPPSRE